MTLPLSAVRSLPPGCILRPAQRVDQAQIRRLLVHLEQETCPGRRWWRRWLWALAIGWGLAIGISPVLFPSLYPLVPSLLQLVAVVSLGLALRGLVNHVQDWDRYWVVDCAGQLVACAKLQPSPQSAILYDLYVLPEWRGQGLGSHLVTHLAHTVSPALYLGCLPARQSFYARLGFVPVPISRLSTRLRYDLGVLNGAGIMPLVWRPPPP